MPSTCTSIRTLDSVSSCTTLLRSTWSLGPPAAWGWLHALLYPLSPRPSGTDGHTPFSWAVKHKGISSLSLASEGDLCLNLRLWLTGHLGNLCECWVSWEVERCEWPITGAIIGCFTFLLKTGRDLDGTTAKSTCNQLSFDRREQVREIRGYSKAVFLSQSNFPSPKPAALVWPKKRYVWGLHAQFLAPGSS